MVVKLRTAKSWPTMGKYLRKSALLKMAQAVGDVDGEIVQAIHDASFDLPVHVEHKEELEFVRSLKPIYEAWS
jgi:hypothetical protein